MFGLDHAPPLRTFVQDPTIIFTALVLLAPLAFLHSIWAALTYLTTPMMLSSFAFLYIVLRLTHSSKCLLLSTRDQRVANWFLMNGVYFNLFLDVVSGQLQMMDAMSSQYSKIEPRYLLGVKHDGGQIVFMTTLLELFFQSPLCLAVYYGYHKGLANRRLCEILVCALHVTGVWYFYVPEIAVNFRHLGGPPISLQDALTLERIVQFWFAFWICGITWIVVPLCIGRTAWKQVCTAIAISKSPSPSSFCKND